MLRENRQRTDAHKDDWAHEVRPSVSWGVCSRLLWVRSTLLRPRCLRARSFSRSLQNHDDHEGMDDTELKAHEEVTKIKNVNRIQVVECRTAHKEMPTSFASTALGPQTLACTPRRRGRERGE
jgi:hypothetical protein